MNLDLALQVEKSATITVESSDDEKTFNKAWEKWNKLSLMFMRMPVANNLKTTLLKTNNAKEFKKFVEERSQTANKSLLGY